MSIGFFSALTLIFIVLKLMGVITWSWWLVLLPSIPGLILLAFLSICSLIWLVAILWAIAKR